MIALVVVAGVILGVAHAVLQADINTVALMSGTILPLLTGVVTKEFASSRLKAVANLVLAIAAGVLSALTLHHGALTWDQIIAAVGQAYIASGITYNHFWKPTGISVAVQGKTATLGIGPAADPAPPAPLPAPEPPPAAAEQAVAEAPAEAPAAEAPPAQPQEGPNA